MIELTKQQVQALGNGESAPSRVMNPRTKETFVLLRVEEYERLMEQEYDNSPWTREELQALAWERVKNEDWDELTMDNPEDQDELNRQLHKPGESQKSSPAMIARKMQVEPTTESEEKKSRSQ